MAALLGNLMSDVNNLGTDNLSFSACIHNILMNSKKLVIINLAYNSVSDDDMISICEGIVKCTTLKMLVLSDNSINDKGVKLLVETLKNSIIAALFVDGNDFESEGHHALVDLITVNQNIQSLSVAPEAGEVIPEDLITIYKEAWGERNPEKLYLK
jgi:Ran GTPase-activating protein (RanGAP) involved in mRNA processing and transport